MLFLISLVLFTPVVWLVFWGEQIRVKIGRPFVDHVL